MSHAFSRLFCPLGFCFEFSLAPYDISFVVIGCCSHHGFGNFLTADRKANGQNYNELV